MSLAKNKGPLLTSKYRGGVDDFPKEFLALVGVDLLVQEVPLDIDPDPIANLLIDSKVEHTRTNERKKTNTFLTEFPGDLPDEVFIARTGQVGHHSRSLVEVGTELPVDALTESAEQHNLGNGWLDQNIVSVDDVFPRRVSSLARRDVTPPEFNAMFPVGELDYTDDTPFDFVTSLDDGVLKLEHQEETEFHTRRNLTFRNLLDLPQQIIDSETNQFKQVKFINKTLDLDSVNPPNPTALQDVSWTHLGDGTAVTRIEAIEELFDEREFSRERGIVTPEDFRAKLQTVDLSAVVEGNAVEPPPFIDGDGFISQATKQLTEFTYRASQRTIDLLDLPLVNINQRTNRFKQVETVTRTLEADTETPAAPTALRDVTFTKLGDGTAVEEKVEVEELFEELSSSIEIPDFLPDAFKAQLPAYIREFNVTGTVDDPPVLLTGEFERTETQYDEFNKKVRTRGRTGLSYPQDVVSIKHIGGEQFGSEITKIAGFLDDDEPLVETGLDVVSSEVRDLGNGTFFRQTEKLDTALEWPILSSDHADFDKEMQIYPELETQVVDPSYSVSIPSVGDYYVETLKPLDQFHARREKITKTPSATDEASAIVTESWRPYQFPGWLDSTAFGYYVRKTRAELCQHIIKTWWMSKATKPTTGITGSGADVEIDPIVQDNVIISTLNDTSRLAYSGECLHDDLTTFGTLFWPETTPNKTDYVGSWIGTSRKIAAEIQPTDIPKLWKIQTIEVVMR